MWTKDKPIESGFYWFYGDVFWDQLPHDEGRNPFEPKLELVQFKVIRNNDILYISHNTFCYNMKGVWWDEKIQEPELPTGII